MAVRLPPMQALRAFEAAARTGSLTRAASGLNLTHGAISHQIKALEEDLGVVLFERAGRGIRLTDDGARFAARVRAAFAELTAGVHELTARANPRLLRVSVVPSFAARWLLPRVGGFMAAHPEIDLDVRASMANVDFTRDDDDVAIRYGLGGWPDVTAEHLLEDWFLPVCSPRIANGVPRRPADLASYPLLRSNDEPWQPWFRVAGIALPEPSRGPIYNDSSHLLQAAVDAQGIALARTSLLGNDVRNGLLVCPFDIFVPATRSFWLVYPQRTAVSTKLAAFRAWLIDEMAVYATSTPHPDAAARQAPRRKPRPTRAIRRT